MTALYVWARQQLFLLAINNQTNRQRNYTFIRWNINSFWLILHFCIIIGGLIVHKSVAIIYTGFVKSLELIWTHDWEECIIRSWKTETVKLFSNVNELFSNIYLFCVRWFRTNNKFAVKCFCAFNRLEFIVMNDWTEKECFFVRCVIINFSWLNIRMLSSNNSRYFKMNGKTVWVFYTTITRWDSEKKSFFFRIF